MTREFIKNVIPREGEVKPFSQYSRFDVVISKANYTLKSSALRRMVKKANEQKKNPELVIHFPGYKVICRIEEK